MAKKRSKVRVKASSRSKKIKKGVKKAVKKKKIAAKKHVECISYDYHGRRKRLEVYDLTKKERDKFVRPIGIKVLVGYLILLLFFYFAYLFVSVKAPVAVIFGQMIGGIQAALLTSVTIAVLLATLYSIHKRRKWGYYLSLVWFAFGIINSIVALVLLKPEVVTVTRNFLALSSFAVFIINIIAIIYIVSEKDYFFAKKFLLKRPRIIDKVFVTLIIIFVVGTLVIGGLLGYDFYKTNIKLADSLIAELEDKTNMQQDEICNSKSEQEKDLCLLVVSIKEGSHLKCNEIESEFYRFACMRA